MTHDWARSAPTCMVGITLAVILGGAGVRHNPTISRLSCGGWAGVRQTRLSRGYPAAVGPGHGTTRLSRGYSARGRDVARRDYPILAVILRRLGWGVARTTILRLSWGG
jgi:hypothetical protein